MISTQPNHDINRREEDLVDKQFLGVVEDPNDPRKEGRARVRVVSIHDDIPVEDLPWAYPKQKSAFFGKEGRGGSLSVPKKGAIVAVRFDNGNPYSPEYYSLHEIAEDVREELGKNGEYLGSHVVLFDGDEELKIWFTISKGITMQLKGSRVNIGRDKAITIEHAESQSIIELRGGNISIHANSRIELTSGSEIEAASNNVWVNGNFVKVGHNPITGPAVLGDRLFLLLTAMASALDAKFPPSPGAVSSVVESFKATTLSQTVKVSL
jgi:hypothetical protein